MRCRLEVKRHIYQLFYTRDDHLSYIFLQPNIVYYLRRKSNEFEDQEEEIGFGAAVVAALHHHHHRINLLAANNIVDITGLHGKRAKKTIVIIKIDSVK